MESFLKMDKLVKKYSYYAYLMEDEKTANKLKMAKKFNYFFLPRYLHFYTTYMCNGRCVMCSNWKRKTKKELNIEELRKIFSSSLFSKLKLVKLTGGEIFERDDYLDIIKLFTYDFPDVRLSVSSNGFPSDRIKKSVQEILEIRDSFEMCFSLDGIGKTHDFIRGRKGVFKEVLNSIEYMINVRKKFPKVVLRLSFTITPYNVKEFSKVQKFSDKHEIYLGYRFADWGDLYKKTHPFKYEQKSKESILNHISKHRDNVFKKTLVEWFLKGEKPLECFTLFSTIYLDPYGNIHTCIKRGVIKSVVGKDPMGIWAKLSKERENIKDCNKCYTDCQAIPDIILERSLL